MKKVFLYILAAASCIALGSCVKQPVSKTPASFATTPEQVCSAYLDTYTGAGDSEGSEDKQTPTENDGVEGLFFSSYQTGWELGAGTDLIGEVTVPAEHLGKPVLRIANDGFAGQTGISDIHLPEGLLSIGERALMNCSSLKTLVIPDSVAAIGSYALSGCKCLESLTLSKNVKSIPAHCVNGCALKELVFPEGLEKLEGEAVENCPDLTSVSFPLSLSSMGECFANCPIQTINIADLTSWCLCEGRMRWGSKQGRKLILNGTEIKELILPEGLSEIRLENAFSCMNIRSVVFPSSLRKISDGAFLNDLLVYIDLREVRSIGKEAFGGCPITSVRFSESLKTIGSSAFYGCPITELLFPSSLTRIDGSAFIGAKAEKIILPEGMQRLGENVFGKELKEITLPSTITEFYPFSTSPDLVKMVYCGTPEQLKKVKKIVHAGGTFTEMKDSDPMPEFFAYEFETDQEKNQYEPHL